MLERLAPWLSSAHGVGMLKVAKIVFLALLSIVILAIWRAPAVKPGKESQTLLRWGCALLFVLVLFYQATWQIGGHTKPKFVKFMRQYNRRPDAATKQVLRGPLLDRRGMVLTAPVRGEVWGRRYPLGAAGAHPLGYYHPRYGMSGVERACDPVLSGYPPANADIRTSGRALFAQRAEEGGPVTLTLDARLQLKAYELLAGRKGAVVVMCPVDGALLALVSSPGFDPRNPGSAMHDNQHKPAFNRAVQGRYPPGSVLKILVAAATLEKGINPTLPCPANGYIAAPATPAIRDNEYYACQKRGTIWKGWGVMNMKDAFVHSSNVYFAQLGVACGVEDFQRMMEDAFVNKPFQYLITSDTSISSARGNFPSVRKSAELAHLSIGQGSVLVTPLHVASFTAAVAAGGRMMQPRLLLKEHPLALSRICSERTAAQVSAMMREAVVKGTGRGANIATLEVCGKTGTAQVNGGDDHAWFTCFTPQRKPRLVVTVLIEHGGFGAAVALPVARAIMLEADKLGYVR